MAHSIAAACKPNRDELYTPKILVDPLYAHLYCWAVKFHEKHNRMPVILSPWDTKNSEYVRGFKDKRYKEDWKVLYGHISTGQDFWTHPYDHWDICISNPPFSQKKKIWEKLFELDKPFALLSNVMALNYMEIGSLFAEKQINEQQIQLLLFDKRVSFDGNPSSFASGYYCYNFLSDNLIFEHLPHCNSGKDFKPSRMYES